MEEDSSITIGGDCDGRMEVFKFDATKYILSDDDVVDSPAVLDSFLFRPFFFGEALFGGLLVGECDVVF